MQLFSFCLFTIIFGYSLVISAPVKPTTPDSQETKHQKATAIASRLLKEIAGEHLAPHHAEQSTNEDAIKPVNHQATEKVDSHVAGQSDDNNVVDDSEEIEYVPTVDDLYDFYMEKYGQLPDDDDEDSSEFIDDDYMLPVNKEQLLRYLAQQEEGDEHEMPVVHTPVMDDAVMTAEDHHHQRRRRSLY